MKIRDWKKYQHFKDRRPPWIKLYRDLLDDPDWHGLGGNDAKHLVMLWLIASEDRTGEGSLPGVGKIAFRLRIGLEQTKQLLNRLSHWLIQDDITTISDRYQVGPPETETETETETDIRAIEFDEFCKAYPKRQGANPKAPARLKFLSLVKAGVDPAAIIAGARGYAAAESKNIGTPYIPMMTVFLNQRRWEDYCGANAPPPIDDAEFARLKAEYDAKIMRTA